MGEWFGALFHSCTDRFGRYKPPGVFAGVKNKSRDNYETLKVGDGESDCKADDVDKARSLVMS